MDAIQAARSLGKAIQADETYIAMMLASQKTQEDDKLQTMIKEFNQLRTDLNAELQNPDKDSEKVGEMNTRLRQHYQDIFSNENMIQFNSTKEELDRMLSYVNQIITGSAQGQDPDTIEYQESCGGDCGGCSGCS